MQYIRGSIPSSPLHSTQNSDIIYTNHKTDSVTRNYVLFLDQNVVGPTSVSIAQTADGYTVSDREDTVPMETARTGSVMDRPDSILQISGVGHWFLEGWIGDHSVELLVDSGTPEHWWERWDVLEEHCAAPTGLGSRYWDVLTAWYCSWDYKQSFPSSYVTWPRARMPLLGLILWAWCCHILWISKTAYSSRMGVSHYSYIGLTPPFPAVFLRLATARYHHIQKQYSIAPSARRAAVQCHPADYGRDLHYLRRIHALSWVEPKTIYGEDGTASVVL